MKKSTLLGLLAGSFVDKVNEAGEGVVKIDVRGGPEAIGMFQQPDAVRDGIVDMVYTPGSFYGGALPEKDAMVASNLTAVYLGWFDSGVCYNLWTRDEPAFDDDGNLEVEGLKLRGNAVYNAFFTNYGTNFLTTESNRVFSLPIWVSSSTLRNGTASVMSQKRFFRMSPFNTNRTVSKRCAVNVMKTSRHSMRQV